MSTGGTPGREPQVLTRQGWLSAGAAVALLAGGRILGLAELFALGGAVIALIVACSVTVGAARLDLAISRSVHPARVHVGSSSRVELHVRNTHVRRSPVLGLRDPVTGTRGAELQLAPLGPHEQAVAAYRLPTNRRGLLQVGPLEVVVTDPFGLARVRAPAAPTADVIVYPHVDEIRPLPHTSGHDPLAGIRQPNSLGRSGEDFYALRPYVVGDDLRRVHWPSTARHDELMLRQNELPWQGRTTVLLDVRAHAHAGESLEVAVSAVASVVTATTRRADLVRLVGTGGADSEFGTGTDHLEAIMEHLAVVEATADGNLRRTLEHVGRTSSGGALVVVLGDPPDGDLRAAAGLRPRFGSLTVVTVDRSAWDPAASQHPPSAALAAVSSVRVARGLPFAAGWDDHLARLGRSRSLAVGARR